ncbi:serine protease inhibitor 3/4-like [Venturia canescens]|uniref:serine protease inhibitor 3/4-like n=1 Tax=Venturia canescens TaxID=32260 RepID=UPI001C9CC4D8|nr:serine protease inhibitor 3/4-like [Venturia canescens]
MLLLYIIGIVTWSIANCNGGPLETLVADNVAELLVDHILNHLTPPRIAHLAHLLDEYENHHKAKSIANSLNDFTMKAYESIVRDEYEDIIFSPFTTYMSLSMLGYGASGPTEEQVHALLEQDFYEPLDAQKKFSAIIDLLNGFSPSEFNMKYKIFYPNICAPTPLFKKIEKIFRIHSGIVDFRTSLVQAKTTINNWFSDNKVGLSNIRSTQSVINDLNEDTNMVITNAIFFNRKFERALSVDVPRWFPDHEQVHAKHERQYYVAEGIYSHGEIPEIHAKFIELPYQNNGEKVNMSMFIVMPGIDGSFAEIESFIDKITMEILLKRSYARIKASFPSLSFSTVRELTLPLGHSLRVPEIFSPEADFSRYFDCPKQHVTKFIQKNIVVMRTDGGELQQQSNAIVPGENLERWETNSTDIEFVVDRSFIVIIAVTSPIPSILLIGQRQK